jgi:hypothetical protein
MNLIALKAEILTGPLASELATPVARGNHRAADGSGVADILNREDRVSSKAVPAWYAKRLLILAGKWRGIVKASLDDAHEAVEAAFALIELANDSRMELDFNDSDLLFKPLVGAGLVGDEDLQAIRALSAVTVSRAVEVFGAPVSAQDVGQALLKG